MMKNLLKNISKIVKNNYWELKSFNLHVILVNEGRILYNSSEPLLCHHSENKYKEPNNNSLTEIKFTN